MHTSFKDIDTIMRRIDGLDTQLDTGGDTDLRNKSKETKAILLFENGKKPIDIGIELDIPYSEVEERQQEYWALKMLSKFLR